MKGKDFSFKFTLRYIFVSGHSVIREKGSSQFFSPRLKRLNEEEFSGMEYIGNVRTFQ